MFWTVCKYMQNLGINLWELTSTGGAVRKGATPFVEQQEVDGGPGPVNPHLNQFR